MKILSMKKHVFVLSLLFASLVLVSQTPRLSLVEEFTGETCPPCAANNPAFNALLAQPTNTSKVVPIKWQVPIPSAPTKTWSLYQTNKAEINWRYSTYGYGINSAPSVRIDGQMPTVFGAGGQNVTQMNSTVFSTAQSYTSAFSISMDRAWNKNCSAVTLTITVEATAPFTSSGALRFRTVMVEREIQFAVQPGSNGETHFEDVAIKSFPTLQSGVTLPTTWTLGQTETFTLNCPIPSYTRKKEEIAFVGFIQDDGNRKVAQAARLGKEPLPQDALSGVSVNVDLTCNTTITPTVEIKNKSLLNAITNLTLTPYIDGNVGSTTAWSGNLLPEASTIIVLNPITVPAVSGSHTFSFDINMPASVYNLIENNTRMDFMVAANYQNTSIAEGFSTTVYPPPGFGIINKNNGPSWSRNLFAGAFNIYPLESSKYDFFNNTVIGDKDELYLPPMDLSAATDAHLFFDIAYAQRTNDSWDALDVLVSDDCGLTWESVYGNSGLTMATTSLRTFAYTPDPSNASEWRTEIADLSNFHKPNVLIKFVTTNDNGNNLFLDNIRVTMDATTSIRNVSKPDLTFLVYPNPANKDLRITVNNAKAGNAALSVLNTLGQIVYKKEISLHEGNNTIQLDVTDYAAGIYYVTMDSDDGSGVKKITVNK